MIEAMLQFTAPALLAHQCETGRAVRRGNRHAALVPHGIWAAAGVDQWLAVSVNSDAAFAALGQAIGRPDWAQQAWQSIDVRRARQGEIEAAIAAWSARQEPRAAAARLQSLGVPAAPLLHAQELFDNAHFASADFYIDLVREFSGPQRQVGVAIIQDGRRLGAHAPAPLLGEHSAQVLRDHAGVDAARFDALVNEGVVSFTPAPSRNVVAASK
jgi:crotonobetainyl-CoA:carnitine CoA-transferase CaiB-like acyl-CoA transferase